MKTENPLAGSKESVSMIRDTLYHAYKRTQIYTRIYTGCKSGRRFTLIPCFIGPAAGLEFIAAAAQVDYSLNLRSLRSMLCHQCCPRYIHKFFEG